ncbi:MAG: hypothetical protein ACM32O_08540 [Clostridia bacterium]
MSRVEALIDQLYTRVRHQVKPEIEAFHITCDEIRQLSSQGCFSERIECELTLVWKDGSLSVCRFSYPPGADQSDLPWLKWYELRYFQPKRRMMLKAHRPLPEVAVYDPAIDTCIRSARLPKLPARVSCTLTVQHRTVAHTRGLYRQDDLSLCQIDSQDFCNRPVMSSRRLPTREKLHYLSVENRWFRSQRLSPLSKHKLTGEMVLLLAPAYLRAICYSVWLSGNFPHTLPLAFRYDPLVDWAEGSSRLQRNGGQARTFGLEGKVRQTEDIIPEAFHWQASTNCLFHEWLAEQPHVLFLSHPVEKTLNLEPNHAGIAYAFVFEHGRLTSGGSCMLPVSSPELLASLLPIAIHKPVWDAAAAVAPYNKPQD